MGAGVPGRLQGVPGWQRGWPLPRGRATFSDELELGGGEGGPQGSSLFSWVIPLSAPSRTPQGSISGVTRCVSHHQQARMGRWVSRPVGRAVEGPCAEAPRHRLTRL